MLQILNNKTAKSVRQEFKSRSKCIADHNIKHIRHDTGIICISYV